MVKVQPILALAFRAVALALAAGLFALTLAGFLHDGQH